MRALFIGCVESSEVFLKELLETELEFVGIVTMRQSAFNADFRDLSEIARNNFIDCFFTEDINDAESVAYIREKAPEIIFCLGWSRLLCKEVLSIPSRGVIGFHPAELPNNRGRHPIIWALALGLKRTASTFFIMDESADTGKIISQKIIEICYEDDARTLYDKVLVAGREQLREIVSNYENGSVPNNLIQRDASEGNSWRKRGKADGKIDWRMSSKTIYNLVRALTKPYVGAHFVFDGKDYKVWHAREYLEVLPDNIEPGKIIKVFSSTHFIVKTGENALEITECDAIDLSAVQYLKE